MFTLESYSAYLTLTLNCQIFWQITSQHRLTDLFVPADTCRTNSAALIVIRMNPDENDDFGDDQVPVLVSLLPSDSNQPIPSDPLLQNNNSFDDPVISAAQSTSSPLPPPCPVTILTGFLGAGKTTLVQYILQSPYHGKRIAVIENEFGGDKNNISDGTKTTSSALSIESMIARDGLTSESLQEFIELPNGCICCTVKDSLVLTLEQLLDKRSDLDYILIECSGLANPGPIASIFWLDDALESRLRLDGIVTLVDAYRIEQQLTETVEASQQIAYADRILLNKIDLLSPNKSGNGNKTENDEDAAVQRLCAVIRGIHPTAAIQTTSYSAVPDLDWILDAGCFDVARTKEIMDWNILPNKNAFLQASSGNPDELICSPCESSESQRHTHTSAVSTVSLYISGSVYIHKVHQWLATLLEHNDSLEAENSTAIDTKIAGSNTDQKQQIFRLKGILSVWRSDDTEGEKLRIATENDGQDETRHLDSRRFIVQGVYDLYDIYPCTSVDLHWNDSCPEERCCKMIVIGRNLDAASLQSGFEKAYHR